MPRPGRREDDRDSPRTESESFKQSLYGELTTPEAMEEAARRKDKTEEDKGKFFGHKNFYFWLYNFTKKHFVKKPPKSYEMPTATELGARAGKGGKKKKQLSKQYIEAFEFLGWDLDPDVVMKMPMAIGIIALILGVIIAAAIYLPLSQTPEIKAECGDGICAELKGEDPNTCPQDCAGDIVRRAQSGARTSPLLMLMIMFIPVFLTLGLVSYTQRYPISAANNEKMRALTYVPELMNYMVMQMRLQPNLERAVEFAAEHGKGRIAEEFRDIVWKNQVGIYDSIEEALDEMAYRWEPYSEEFKHAITMIRASVLVPDSVERNVLYDKAIEDITESTKDKMELYAHSMKQPSMYLFYIAILLPLMIIIMLPVAAAFANLPVASTPILVALYIFILPLITLFYAKFVLAKRPGGYVPPVIRDDHPELPKKGTMELGGIKLPVLPVAIMLLITIVAVGMFIDSAIKIPKEHLADLEEQLGKKIEQPTILQYIIPLAIAIPLGFYLYGISVNKRRIQEKILKMELDFKDAMYLLASRLGDKKPLEDALKYVKKFMPESKVATELLDSVERNIMVMGLTLKSAIFDPVYGAMKYVPSRLINSSFKIMVDSIELGPEVASTSLISVSNQIRNVQKINELMKTLLEDVTSMMRSMATFIAPIVLGVVASLQQIITAVVSPLQANSGTIADKGSAAAIESARGSLGGIGSIGNITSMATPFEFQLIIALYVVELVIILAYFAGKINYGDNRTAIMMTIGKALPIAISIFVVALYFGSGLMAGMAG